MTDEQRKKVIEALVDFVVRVADGRLESETEMVALPAVVDALLRHDVSL